MFIRVRLDTILITGGTGFIGSHTAVELLERGYQVILMDNLSNSKRGVLSKVKKITGLWPLFLKADCTDYETLNHLFSNTRIDAVIHMAGFKSVSESLKNPLNYYHNNLRCTMNILQSMKDRNVSRLIFSSSATVYGSQEGYECYEETFPTGVNITNPYGKTKYMIEEILKDYLREDNRLAISILRYFNPVGSHPSGLLGEDPNDTPTNLMPIVMKVLKRKQSYLQIFGTNYPTPDGSCIRDYIHVVDLAKGHIAALLHSQPGMQVYNLGTGHGTSVLEIVSKVEQVTGKQLPIKIVERRLGDLPAVYANPAKANIELNWTAERTVEQAITDTIHYLKQKNDQDRQELILLVILCVICVYYSFCLYQTFRNKHQHLD